MGNIGLNRLLKTVCGQVKHNYLRYEIMPHTFHSAWLVASARFQQPVKANVAQVLDPAAILSCGCMRPVKFPAERRGRLAQVAEWQERLWLKIRDLKRTNS
jgi:hypothetical protein